MTSGPRCDSNTQPSKVESEALPLRHEVLTEIFSKNFIRMLCGRKPFMSEADVLQKTCELN